MPVKSYSTSFFFAYFASGVKIKNIVDINKEFINKYKALKESIRADLFLVVEVEIDDVQWDIVILIELKSKRENVAKKMLEYMCYASLLRQLPVWGIAFYSDEAHWVKPINNSFPFAYTKDTGIIRVPYDIIKLKEHKSAELIKQNSLFLKIMALKADDRGCDREDLIREIYQAVSDQEEELTSDQKLLIERFVSYYAKLPKKTVDKVRKEVKMTFVASTITEDIRHEGEMIGRAHSEAELKRVKTQAEADLKQAKAELKQAEAEAKQAGAEAKQAEVEVRRAALTNLEELYEEGLITKKVFETKAGPLRKALLKRSPAGESPTVKD